MVTATEARDPLVEMLEGGSETYRSLAADALKPLPSPEAVPALSATLSDSAENLRSQSLGALEGMVRDPDFEARIYSAEALKSLPKG
jgi:HEAT repeat protein